MFKTIAVLAFALIFTPAFAADDSDLEMLVERRHAFEQQVQAMGDGIAMEQSALAALESQVASAAPPIEGGADLDPVATGSLTSDDVTTDWTGAPLVESLDTREAYEAILTP